MFYFFNRILCCQYNEVFLNKIFNNYLKSNTLSDLQNKVWTCVAKYIDYIDMDIVNWLIYKNYITKNNISYLYVLMLRHPRLNIIKRYYESLTFEEKQLFLEKLDINSICRVACYGNFHNLLWISTLKEIPYKLVYIYAEKIQSKNICKWIEDTYNDGKQIITMKNIFNSEEFRRIRRIY